MKQILPHLYTFTGLFMGRVYLIEDGNDLTLIDTGLESAADKILKQLHQYGYKSQNVKQILITHAHPDHIGGLPKVQAETGAEVISSEIDRPVIEGKAPSPHAPKEHVSGLARFMIPKEETYFPPTTVTRTVQEGDILDIMGGLHVLATPGHTLGHLTFWQPDQKIAFCGDVIMCRPWMNLPFSAFTVDMETNKRSIRRLADLNASVMCFGHGSPLVKNTAEKIRAFAQKVGV